MDFSGMFPTDEILIKNHKDLIARCNVCLSLSSELQRSSSELRMNAAVLREKSAQLCSEANNLIQQSKVKKQ